MSQNIVLDLLDSHSANNTRPCITQSSWKTHKRPEHFANFQGIQNSFSQRTKTQTKSLIMKTLVGRKTKTSKKLQNLPKKGIVDQVSPLEDQFLNKLLIVKPRDGEKQACHQTKWTKPGLYSYAFKNRKSKNSKNSVAYKWLYVQTVPKRCLFQCFHFIGG